MSEHLFSPLTLRGLTLENRIAVSPMCQYSCNNGFVTEWHLVHLGSRAIGGAGLVIVEAAAVTPEGRISPADVGIWMDEQGDALARIAHFMREYGSVPGIQLAHAGRKASTQAPWEGNSAVPPEKGGWIPVAPSALPFRPEDPMPHEMTIDEIRGMVAAFRAAAERSLRAGFQVIEIHGAHGYLLNEFLSPLTNRRTDEYGGSFENRVRALQEVAAAIRSVWPENLPLFLRISATDWVDGGWTIEDSVALGRLAKGWGIDLIDCSSGGNSPSAKIPVGPGYQVAFSEQVRREAGIKTGAVGMITEPQQADAIIRGGKADLVLLARQMLRNPYWPIQAAVELGQRARIPVQYQRAFPRM